MNSDRDVYVLGAGGHAKVVISTLRATGYQVVAVYDDDASKWHTTCLGVPVVGPVAQLLASPVPQAVIAIGNNFIRKRIAEQFAGVQWVTVVHPAAYVDVSVSLGAGAVVFAGAVIQPETVIGAHTIINTGATVDHDCRLGEYVHIAPGTHLAGGVHLGEGAFLGIGSVVTPGIAIGAWSRVGAGGVVVSDLPPAVLAVGVPAQKIREIEPNE